jgi:hypothetical protein
MQETFERSVPAWFWIVAVLAVAWEAFGAYTYTSQSLIPDAERVGDYKTMQSWQWGVFAFAVWTGLLGAVALLLRRRWATLMLLISLISAVVQYGYAAVSGGISSEALPIAIAILTVGLILVIVSSRSARAGWLR